MILIVGGTGFLGRSMAHWLTNQGKCVRLISRTPPRAPLPDAAQCIQANLEHLPLRQDIFAGVHTVIHLVHSTKPACSMRDMAADIQANLPPSVALMQAAQHFGARRMLFISSGGTVYGIPRYLPMDEEHPTNPICSYGITKLAIEKYLGMFCTLNPDFTGITLRLSNPYGPYQPPDTGQGVIADFLYRTHRGAPLDIWGDGTVVRDFIHIDDVLRAITAIIDEPPHSGVFNLGSGQGTSLNQIIETIRRVSGRDIPVRHHPGRSFDIPQVTLDTTRLRHTLPDWQPKIELEKGIAKLWNALYKPDQIATSCHNAEFSSPLPFNSSSEHPHEF